MRDFARQQKRLGAAVLVSLAALASIIAGLANRRVEMPVAQVANPAANLGAPVARPVVADVPPAATVRGDGAGTAGATHASSARPQQAESDLITINVLTEYTEPADNIDGAGCRGLAAKQPSCSWTATGVATFTGTFWGTSPFDCTSELPSFTADGKLMFTCNDYVTGGVTGCGTGSFIIEDHDAYIDYGRYDPATNSAPGYNTWVVRPNSATGTLADHLVSGHGENHWTFYVNGELGVQPDSGRGTFTGTITCRA